MNNNNNKMMNNEELVALGYASQQIRAKAPQAIIKQAMQAYINLRMANAKNSGRAGLKFEIEFRYFMNPRTTQVIAQKAGKADIIKYNRSNGKQVVIEAKTGAGKIGYNVDINANIYDYFTADYYAYNPFYYDHYDISQTVIFTRDAFIKFLDGSSGKWYTYKKNDCGYDLAIQNFRIQKGRKTNKRHDYFMNIMDYALENDGCYFIDEFLSAIE